MGVLLHGLLAGGQTNQGFIKRWAHQQSLKSFVIINVRFDDDVNFDDHPVPGVVAAAALPRRWLGA